MSLWTDFYVYIFLFLDTCVVDEDCEDFPNTVCKNTPVNIGLDPGTREIPFKGNNYSNIF